MEQEIAPGRKFNSVPQCYAYIKKMRYVIKVFKFFEEQTE